jgi:hypothetical protein
MEPVVLPSHAVFQPSRSKLLAAKEKPNYLGKSQVVAARDKDENSNSLHQMVNATLMPILFMHGSESNETENGENGLEAHQPQSISLVG